jgi:transcriptional antiterminator NusG
MTCQNVTLAGNVPNALSRKDVIRFAAGAGKETAAGADALPGLARQVVLGASQGTLSLVRKINGHDDASAIYATYACARDRQAKLDFRSDARRAQASKLRQLIKMGGGPGNPVDIIDQVIDAHQRALSQEQPHGTRVRGLYATMVSAARAQIKYQRDLTRAEIQEVVCRVITPPTPKAADVLAKIEVMLTALIETGEKSTEVSEARALIRQRIMGAENSQPVEVEADMRWYAVPCKSGSENEVARSIREQQRGLGDVIEEVDAERKFLCGYVLAKMKLTDDVRQLIKSTPKVRRGGKLMPIADEEVERMLRKLEERPKEPAIEINDQVQISSGPLASHNGTVVDVDEAHSRLKVEVSIFGQATPVDIGFGEVEKL